MQDTNVPSPTARYPSSTTRGYVTHPPTPNSGWNAKGWTFLIVRGVRINGRKASTAGEDRGGHMSWRGINFWAGSGMMVNSNICSNICSNM